MKTHSLFYISTLGPGLKRKSFRPLKTAVLSGQSAQMQKTSAFSQRNHFRVDGACITFSHMISSPQISLSLQSPFRTTHVDIAALSLDNTSSQVPPLEPRRRLIAFTSE